MHGELPVVALVVGLIPVLWSSVVAVLRALTTRRADIGVESMRAEAAVLGMMLSPVFIGTALLAFGSQMPRPTLLLPKLNNMISQISPASDLTTHAGFDLDFNPWQFMAFAATAIYLLGLCVAATRLLLARARLGRIANAGAPCPALGDDVRLSAETDFAFACSRGIVLPRELATTLSAHELTLVVRHERAHIERGDPRTYWALAWVDALLWPNPFVHRQTARCRLAAELACDCAVIAGAPDSRATYAVALVAAIRHAAHAPCWMPGISSTRSKGESHLRITRILDPPPPPQNGLSCLVAAATGLLVIPVGLLQLAACVTKAPDVVTLQLPRDPQGGPTLPMARELAPRKLPNNAASEAVVRRMTGEFMRGQPPALAPILSQMYAKLGAFESISFVGVYSTGADVFDVRHANGIARWDVILAPDGTAKSLHIRRKLDSGDTMWFGTKEPQTRRST